MFSVLIFLFGLIIGSFLNVVIYRLKTKESIFSPHLLKIFFKRRSLSSKGAGLMTRSHCPKCRVVLRWYDLIPLFSFVLQKGRCRYCYNRISWQYPLVELAAGILFLLISFKVLDFRFGIWDLSRIKYGIEIRNLLLLIYWFYIISILIIIFVYDLKDCLLSALVASVFFLFLVLVSKGKWMGMGDVKLAVLMGLVLGWPNVLWALFLAFMSGAVIGLVLIAFKKKTLKSQIPFGPFLAGAAVFMMLFGESLTPHLLNLININ